MMSSVLEVQSPDLLKGNITAIDPLAGITDAATS